MTSLSPSTDPHASPSESPPTPSPDVAALQMQLLTVSGLLGRLLARLEVPSGEASEQIAEVLSRLSALTLSLTRTAEAMERIASEEGALGQIGAELQGIRTRQEAQDRQLAAVAHRTAMMMDWLTGGAAPEETATAPGSRTTAST